MNAKLQLCQSIHNTNNSTTTKANISTIVECATSPMFKEDLRPKRLPDIHTSLTDIEQQHTNFIKRKQAQSNSSIIVVLTRLILVDFLLTLPVPALP